MLRNVWSLVLLATGKGVLKHNWAHDPSME